MNLSEKARAAVRELDEALFPSGIYCLCCGSMIDRTRMYSLCDDCIGRFHWITGRTCGKCGKAMPDTSKGRLCYDCMLQEHLFERGFSCLTYGLHEREIMMDLKYGGKGYIARKCGDMMFDRMEEEIRNGCFSSCGVKIDLIVPVPVSDGRLQKRGYNQSALMARQLARRWRESARNSGGEMPEAPALRENLLERTRETQMLRSLNPAERALELKGVFRVKLRFAGELPGRTVLLIDDIYTTGATADACSRALLSGGAAGVYLLSLASGGNRKPGQ